MKITKLIILSKQLNIIIIIINTRIINLNNKIFD